MDLHSAVPSLFCGGAPGANQEVTCSFHLPASFASFWCSGPGVAAFMYFSIIACSAADGWCCAALPGSCALAAATGSASAAAMANRATAAVLGDVIAASRSSLVRRGLPSRGRRALGARQDSAGAGRVPAALHRMLGLGGRKTHCKSTVLDPFDRGNHLVDSGALMNSRPPSVAPLRSRNR